MRLVVKEGLTYYHIMKRVSLSTITRLVYSMICIDLRSKLRLQTVVDFS